MTVGEATQRVVVQRLQRGQLIVEVGGVLGSVRVDGHDLLLFLSRLLLLVLFSRLLRLLPLLLLLLLLLLLPKTLLQPVGGRQTTLWSRANMSAGHDTLPFAMFTKYNHRIVHEIEMLHEIESVF